MPLFKFFYKVGTSLLIGAFLSTSVYIPQARAGEVVVPIMPAPGTMVQLSSSFSGAHLQGLTIHPDNALQFDFLIHKGDGHLDLVQKKQEYTKLIKYFLASLTVPDKDQWVNLSPYEKGRIIDNNFAKTEMGRDLLEQDYLLKQLTSSLMYPEKGLGKSFWDKVYAQAWREYHTTDIPVNTFNKVWIIPDEAVVYESGNTAYIIKTHLKVMLEEDYLALSKYQRQPGDMFLSEQQGTCPQAGCQPNKALNVKASQVNNLTHNLASQIIRQVILPQIEHEVNEGKNFAQLRQIVSGMILATWYKKTLKDSLLGKIYADKAKIQGITVIPASSTVIPAKAGIQNMDVNIIYQQYLAAFKKGVYNYIKEDFDRYSRQTVPRKYFAGGFRNPSQVSVVHDLNLPYLAYAAQSSWAGAYNNIDQATVDLQTPKSNDMDAAMADMESPQRISLELMKKKYLDALTIYAEDSSKENENKLIKIARAFAKVAAQSGINSQEGLRQLLLEPSENVLIDGFPAEEHTTFPDIIEEAIRNALGVEKLQGDGKEPNQEKLSNMVEFVRKFYDYYYQDETMAREALEKIAASIPSNGSIQGLNTFDLAFPGTAERTSYFRENLRPLFERALLVRANVAIMEYQAPYNGPHILIKVDKNEYEKARQGLIELFRDIIDSFIIDSERDFKGTLSTVEQEIIFKNDKRLLKVGQQVRYRHTRIDRPQEVTVKSIRKANGKANGKLAYEIVLENSEGRQYKLYSRGLYFPVRIIDAAMGVDPTSVDQFERYIVLLKEEGRLLQVTQFTGEQIKDALNAVSQIIHVEYGKGFVELYNTLIVRIEERRKNQPRFRLTDKNIWEIAQTIIKEYRNSFKEYAELRLRWARQEENKRVEFFKNWRVTFDKTLKTGDLESAGNILKEVKKSGNYDQEELEFFQKRLDIEESKRALRFWRHEFNYFLNLRNISKAKEILSAVKSFIQRYKQIYPNDENPGDAFSNLKIQEADKQLSTVSGNDDAAMNTKKESSKDFTLKTIKQSPGGIDLNSANLNMQIKRDGRGVPLPWPKQDMAQLSRIQGFVPVILEIKPAANLPILSELKQSLQN